MLIAAGTTLGAYQVLEKIGEGGMGEVYRARDTRLNREVALKLLPARLAADLDRLARFRREAQLLASLNHPHIAAIYGFEETSATQALVLELVEGPTLAERIAEGPMPLDEASEIARQIADALEAAHEQGIVHRDLKPANVKLTKGGAVKVLDFGLAKLIDAGALPGPPPASLTIATTLISPAVTGLGVILGTACYMSPEQAKGKDTDQRADIWAFAVMFVEMLTGKRLFDGETVTDVIAAVVTRPLPLDRLPTPLRPALSRCLERDPRRRLRHIGDFFALVEASSAPVPPPSTRAPRGLALALTVFASIAAITILAATWSFWRAIPDAPVAQFTFNPPAGQNLTLSSASTSLLRTAPAPVAVSPDGRHIAFLANLPSGRSQIWVRSLDALSAQPLPGTDGATSPFWSLDNNFIAFFADGRLRKIRATGGPPVSLTEVPDYRGDRGETA